MVLAPGQTVSTQTVPSVTAMSVWYWPEGFEVVTVNCVPRTPAVQAGVATSKCVPCAAFTSMAPNEPIGSFTAL